MAPKRYLGGHFDVFLSLFPCCRKLRFSQIIENAQDAKPDFFDFQSCSYRAGTYLERCSSKFGSR